jgi:RNA polymerase sigma factor (sigma-70 family)
MGSPLLFLNSDARILDGIRRGDESALASLYQANRRPITSLVMRNNGTADDANDVLQDALITLWERVRSGNYEHTAALGTFLYATARNLWLRRLARARREQPLDFSNDGACSDDPSPLDELVEDERTVSVRAAVDRLGEPCRSLLVLFYWEEASMEEIARRLGLANASTAKSKKYQCKEQLKRLIDRTTNGHERD